MNEYDEKQSIMPKYIRIFVIMLIAAFLLALVMILAEVVLEA